MGEGGPPTRRALLRSAVAGVSAAGVSAAGVSAAAAAIRGPRSSDAHTLLKLLNVERRLAAAYDQVLAAGALNVIVSAEVSGFRDQERRHLAALTRALGPIAAPPGLRTLPPAGPAPQSQAAALALLLASESHAQAAYYDAMGKLKDPGLARLAAEIMASEAQHSALLQALKNPRNLPAATPEAFVTGSG